MSDNPRDYEWASNGVAESPRPLAVAAAGYPRRMAWIVPAQPTTPDASGRPLSVPPSRDGTQQNAVFCFRYRTQL